MLSLTDTHALPEFGRIWLKYLTAMVFAGEWVVFASFSLHLAVFSFCAPIGRQMNGAIAEYAHSHAHEVGVGGWIKILAIKFAVLEDVAKVLGHRPDDKQEYA